MIEQEDLDLLKIVAYPFIVNNTSNISAKEFIFSISLNAFLCSPSTALLLLKCGYLKGLLIFDTVKKRVTVTFNYRKIKILSYSEDIDKIIRTYCNDAVNCCDDIPSLDSLSDLISSQSSSLKDVANQGNTIDKKPKESIKQHSEKDLVLQKKETQKKKRKKSKRAEHGTSSLEDYF